MSEIGTWLGTQVTLGNIGAFCSTLVAFGYQLRRLQDIERDIANVRDAQKKATAENAATYTRSDVLGVTLMAMNSQLAEIRTDLRELKRHHEGRD